MGSMQRIVLVAAVAMFLTFGTAIVIQKEEKLQKQWEAVQAERLLGSICRTGDLTFGEYLRYQELLGYCGGSVEIRIEEYRKEWNLTTGESCYYLVSWEELQEDMVTDGHYTFEEESVVVVSILIKSRKIQRENSYYDIVSGEDLQNA